MPWQPGPCHWPWLASQCFPDASSPPWRPLAKDTSKQMSRARQLLEQGLKLRHMGRCSSPFFLFWFEQWEHSSLRNSRLTRIMETMIADKSNPASVGLSTQAFSLPPLKPHPSVVQPHPNGSPDWWNLNCWRPWEALDDKRVGRWASEEEWGLQEGTWVGGKTEKNRAIYFQWGWLFYFNLSVFIIVKSYEVDVNGALYALLCYLVLIKSGIVQDVLWPRKTSLHS